MNETKRFPLRVLLTVTTGRLLTEGKGPKNNGIGDLYAILGWMTNDSPFTHQLPRFGQECKPWLLRWFPELAKVQVDLLDEMIEAEGTEKGIEKWLASCYPLLCGKTEYDVPRIPMDDHARKGALEELAEMMGGTEGIVKVIMPEEPRP